MPSLIWNLSVRDCVKACEMLAGLSKDISFLDKAVPGASWVAYSQDSKADANTSKNEDLSGSVMRLLMVIICWQLDFLQVAHFTALSVA